MTLAKYHRKRDFQKTPEPRGKDGAKVGDKSFVIQKHAASRLHYDFRLGMEGVLRSWAVPKGPSLDPKERRLAVHVEDHPLEYGKFEGIIPKGQYGGGAVVLWDRGKWYPEGDPVEGYRKGKLKFRLQGEKLHGSWNLFRIAGKDDESNENWLLVKQDDEEARTGKAGDITAQRPESVLTKRLVEEVAADADLVWQSNRAQPGKDESKPKAGSVRASRARAAALAAATRSTPRTAAAGSATRKPPVKTAGCKPGDAKPKSADAKTKTTARRTSRARARSSSQPDPSELPGARPAPLPSSMEAQLATLVTEVPAGDEWIHEIKYDGYRALCRISGGEARLFSRNGKEWTRQFGNVARAAASLPVTDAWLDGEVVVTAADGVTSFQALQRALGAGESESLRYEVFDLRYLDGHDLTGVPLLKRKEALAGVLAGVKPPLHYADHVAGKGAEFLRSACEHSLEGIVSKLADRPVRAARTTDWLKIRCQKRQEFVIGGFTEPTGSRHGLGALLLGVHDEAGSLRYCGKVGTGFTDAQLLELHGKLHALERATPPFDNPPRGASARGVHWVEPKLVGDVEFTEWTLDGTLRHPSFEGLRVDKSPRSVVREVAKPTRQVVAPAKRAATPAKRVGGKAAKRSAAPAAKAADIAGFRLTSPDRVVYPQVGLTKADVARYYAAVADWILPHVAQRPLTLVRCPEGAPGQCFYQKHARPGMSPSIHRVPVRDSEGTELYLHVDDVAGLLGLVQFGVLELHAWGSHVKDLERPDLLVFDLDPDAAVQWPQVITTAVRVRERLEELGLTSFVKTTGGKGLHVCVPIKPKHDWDTVKAFTKGVVEDLARAHPLDYVTVMSKAKRKGRIFLDYLRNGRGATAVVAYSTRVHPQAPVAWPITWKELTPALKPGGISVPEALRLLSRRKTDPWDGFFDAKQTITAAMLKAVGVE